MTYHSNWFVRKVRISRELLPPDMLYWYVVVSSDDDVQDSIPSPCANMIRRVLASISDIALLAKNVVSVVVGYRCCATTTCFLSINNVHIQLGYMNSIIQLLY